jgi:hypothetical protein
MRIVSNAKLIKRNNKIGQYTSIGSLIILAVGLFYSFKDVEGKYMTLTFSALIVGFILFQIGNYFLSRWGKSPRPDEIINNSLKGLDDKYTLYHYETDISHLLVGPAGVIALLPYPQSGTIAYDSQKHRWTQKGGNFFLKVFAQEGLGRPDADAKDNRDLLNRYLTKLGVEKEQINGISLLVFTNENASIDGTGASTPYVAAEKIKDYIRKQAKEVGFNAEAVTQLIDQKIKA